jgi:acyl-coenzyme A thioesterase PaaI-like protein
LRENDNQEDVVDPLTRLHALKLPFAELLGIAFTEANKERVVAELVVRDELCTSPSVMHGGAIMAFADTLGAAGTILNLPEGAGTTTLESKTILSPAHRGVPGLLVKRRPCIAVAASRSGRRGSRQLKAGWWRS